MVILCLHDDNSLNTAIHCLQIDFFQRQNIYQFHAYSEVLYGDSSLTRQPFRVEVVVVIGGGDGGECGGDGGDG